MLGPVEVRDGDRVLPLPAARVSALLVTLLLRANRVVTVDELVDRVWGEHPPGNPRAALQTTVQRLRRALGDETLIRTRPRGYLIELEPRRLDLLLFRDLVEQAHRVGDLIRRRDLLGQALALWRGPPLAGMTAEPLLRDEVPRLVEERLAAQELWTDVRLDLGEHARLIPELVALTREHPLRERAWGQLMLALYRAGRQGDALRAYRALAGHLAEELGVDPSEELRRLHQAILTADPSLAVTRDQPAPASATVAAPAHGTWRAQCQLPLDISDFVGRDHLIERIEDFLATGDGVPIATVSGLPGVGKTALAIRVAHRLRPRFPDGQWYVRLGGALHRRDPGEVLAELLRTSGVDADEVPERLDARAAAFRARLADRRVLLCLDDAADVEQVEPLLPGTAGCAVLVTARRDLSGLAARYAARGYTLDVLSPVEAAALLARVLGPERAGVEPAVVAELARLCAYLPLALRIAAANLASRPDTSLDRWVTDLRTGDRLSRLALPGEESVAVAAAFDRSYAALAPRPRRLFRLLGLIPGPDFTAPAAAALLGAETGDAERLLDTLASVNLVQRHAADRYLFHDLLRRYAAQLARDDPDRDLAWRRLCDWYLAGARDAPASWLDAERANLVAAVVHAAEHGPGEFAWRLADTLQPYLRRGQHLPEWRAVAQAGLRAAEVAGDRPAQAAMHCAVAVLHERRRGPRPAIRHYRAALDRYRESGDIRGVVSALCGLGINHFIAGEMPAAAAALDEGIALIHRHGPVELLGTALNVRGIVQMLRGDLAGALRSNADAMRAPSPPTISLLINRGGIRRLLGEYEEAAADVAAGLSLAERARERRFEGVGHDELARIRLDAGQFDLAGEHAERALRFARRTDDAWCEAGALISLGDLHRLRGSLDEAGAYYRQALLVSIGKGLRVHEAEAQLGLAALHHRAGCAEAAREHAQVALDITGTAGLDILRCQVLWLLAALADDAGDAAQVNRYAQRARRIERRTGYRPPAQVVWGHRVTGAR